MALSQILSQIWESPEAKLTEQQQQQQNSNNKTRTTTTKKTLWGFNVGCYLSQVLCIWLSRRKNKSRFGGSILCTAQENTFAVPNRWCLCSICNMPWDSISSPVAQLLGLTRMNVNCWRARLGQGRSLFCNQLCHWPAEWLPLSD